MCSWKKWGLREEARIKTLTLATLGKCGKSIKAGREKSGGGLAPARHKRGERKGEKGREAGGAKKVSGGAPPKKTPQGVINEFLGWEVRSAKLSPRVEKGGGARVKRKKSCIGKRYYYHLGGKETDL